MATHDLNPGPFCGRKSEDAEAWLKSVMYWVVYKKLNAESAMAAVALLLKDGALLWYDNLEEDVKHSAENFVREFKKRYVTPDEINKWKDVLAVYDEKHTDGQCVNDYIDLVLKRGSKAKASEEQILAAIIGGLRPNIRRHVLQHEPRTVQDVRKWGSIAESTEEQDNRPSNDLTAAVEEIKKQSAAVRELKEQFENINVRGISCGNASSPSPSARGTPFSARTWRESFPSAERAVYNNYASDGEVRSRGGRNHHQSTSANFTSPPKSNSEYVLRDYTDYGANDWHQDAARAGHGALDYRDAGDRFQPFESTYSDCATAQRSGRLNDSRPCLPPSRDTTLQFERGGRPQMFYNSDRRQNAVMPHDTRCGNCGGEHEWGQCPARGSQCRNCLRFNHWSSVCRNNQLF